MGTYLLIAILLSAMVAVVRSHSWLACAEYSEKNGAVWDPNKCRGYPRDAPQYAQKNSFGQDRGYNHQPGNNGQACKTGLTAASYNNDYPKAIYFPGQQAILTHPMKNHGAASCTNNNIPDNGNAIYRGRIGQDTNEAYSFYKSRLVSDLGISKTGSALTAPDQYPKPGFQNAPNFCDNTDKSMATYSFNVPQDLAAGEYTFVWSWAFNSQNDVYTTCFDVIIAADKAQRDQMLLGRQPNMDLSVPCGGTVSNEGAGSEIGCDEEITTTTTTTTTTSTNSPGGGSGNQGGGCHNGADAAPKFNTMLWLVIVPCLLSLM